MLLCVRERSLNENRNHSSLQRQFSHGHSQKFEDGVTAGGTRISHFLPTSRRIVQFSNGKVHTVLYKLQKSFHFVYYFFVHRFSCALIFHYMKLLKVRNTTKLQIYIIQNFYVRQFYVIFILRWKLYLDYLLTLDIRGPKTQLNWAL